MIEVGQHRGGPGAVMLHSTESGQFFACTRVEFERLIAAGIRGDLDAVMLFKEPSAVADGDPDWQRARRALAEPPPEPGVFHRIEHGDAPSDAG